MEGVELGENKERGKIENYDRVDVRLPVTEEQ